MHVVNHHTMNELAAMAKVEPSARVVRRIFAVLEAMRERSAKEIGAGFGAGRRTVQEWVESYNRSGIDGLRDKPGRGRRPKLAPERLDEFKARIMAGPTEADGGVCTLRGRDAKRILEEQFGVVQSLSAAYETLKRAGLTALRPRPRHPKSDPEAMAQWEASAPLLSRECAKRIRTRRSKSGSRTRRASASRAR